MAYRDDFRSVQRETNWTIGRVLKWMFGLGIPVLIVLSVTGAVLGWFGEAQQVAREEFGPREMLRKYEWFKDAAAGLDKKVADISMYDSRIAKLEEDWKDTPRKEWPKDVRTRLDQWEAYRIGIRSSYNMLAADYNAQMAKFNWRFAEAGRLPEGATTPLPREYKPYQD